MKQNKEIPAGYKDSPLGIIPEDWEVKRLEEVGNVLSGLTYSPEDICPDGLLVLRSSNIQEKQLAFNDNVFVKSTSHTPVQENDILICVRNGSRNLIGKNALIDKRAEGMAFGAFMSIFRSRHNKYLYQLFDTPYYYQEINKNIGATINSINGSDLKKFLFPFPPLHEQNKISDILGIWDTAIEKQQKLIEKLEIRKRGLMQQLLTARIRINGFPGSWQTIKMCKVFKRITRKNTELNDNVVTISAQRGFVKQTDFFNKTIASEIIDNYFLVK